MPLAADRNSSADVKQDFGNPTPNVVLNIAGNKYRLVMWISYIYHAACTQFIAPYSTLCFPAESLIKRPQAHEHKKVIDHSHFK